MRGREVNFHISHFLKSLAHSAMFTEWQLQQGETKECGLYQNSG